jgi:uncharacterized protein (TIGR03546 family)
MRHPKTTLESISGLLHVSGMDSPNRLAAGLCLGIWIGLFPKLSLIPWCLAVLGILSTANLATLIAGFVIGCLAIPLADLVALPLGEKLLSLEALSPLLSQAIETPVLTHARFHEAATTGTLALGLLLMLPAFFLTRALFKQIQPRLEQWLSFGSSGNWTVSRDQVQRSAPRP